MGKESAKKPNWLDPKIPLEKLDQFGQIARGVAEEARGKNLSQKEIELKTRQILKDWLAD